MKLFIREVNAFKPFNLSQDALVRFHVIEVTSDVGADGDTYATNVIENDNNQTKPKQPLNAQKDYLLLLCFHHIISDGWSIDLFIKDTIQFYQHFSYQQALPELYQTEASYQSCQYPRLTWQY